MIKLKLFDKAYDNAYKLDCKLSQVVEKYERFNYDMGKLNRDLHSFIIDLFEKFSFNIENINRDRFNLDYLIYLDDNEYIVNVDIDFHSSGENLFFFYNNIYIVTTDGEVIKNIANEFVKILNED